MPHRIGPGPYDYGTLFPCCFGLKPKHKFGCYKDRKEKNQMAVPVNPPQLKYFARKIDGSKNVGPFDDPNDVVVWIQNQGRESSKYTVETLESAV